MVESLARWVADEYESKRQERVDTSDWPRRYLKVLRLPRCTSQEPCASCKAMHGCDSVCDLAAKTICCLSLRKPMTGLHFA